MSEQDRPYHGDGVVVRYNARRCIHAAVCIRRLPEVFNTKQRPWISPNNAELEPLLAAVAQCPTGALHAERLDGQPAETPSEQATIHIRSDGPLYLRGDITIEREDGTLIAKDSRVALCRCGQSANKPFCDGAHKQGFSDPGQIAEQASTQENAAGPITIVVSERGPYLIRGSVAIQNAERSETRQCQQSALCRCGASTHKPFCDGSHLQIDQEIFL